MISRTPDFIKTYNYFILISSNIGNNSLYLTVYISGNHTEYIFTYRKKGQYIIINGRLSDKVTWVRIKLSSMVDVPFTIL